MEDRRTLYLIGGVPRSGKSTVANRMARHGLITLPTDFIRSIIRSALVGNAPINVDTFSFEGAASYGEGQLWPIEAKNFSEDALAWRCAVSLINNYDTADRNDVLFEGVAITPEGTNALTLKNLIPKIAFVGYNDESHAENIIAHAKEAHDYIYGEMLRSGKGDDYVRENIKNDIRRSDEIKRRAEEFGYAYFDATKSPSFEDHVQAVMKFLLA